MSLCIERALIDHHFEAQIAPTGEQQMRAHLEECPACRDYYNRWALLNSLDPEGLGLKERLAQGLGFKVIQAEQHQRSRRFWLLLPLAAAAALLLLFQLQDPQGLPSTENGVFYARGGISADVAAFSAPGERVAREIQRQDALSFSYLNPKGRSHLMIYAVDEGGRIYWFHPPWLNSEENPEAIRVQKSEQHRELPGAMAHDYQGRRLWLHSILSNQPFQVREIEALALGRAPGAALLLPDVEQPRPLEIEIR